jgi:hypothetical protein
MKTEKNQRSCYLRINHSIKLTKTPICIFGYDKSDKFVCRLEIYPAGLTVFSGKRGGKQLCNLSWEGFVKKLTDEK